MPRVFAGFLFCYFAGYGIISSTQGITGDFTQVLNLFYYSFLAVIFARGVIGITKDFKNWLRTLFNGD